MTALFTLAICAMVVVTEVFSQQYYYSPPASRKQPQGYAYAPYQGHPRPQGVQARSYPITSYPAPPPGYQAGPPPPRQVYQPYPGQYQPPPYNGNRRGSSLASPGDPSGTGAVVHELIGTGLDVARGLAQPNAMDAAAVFLRRGQRLVSRLGGGNGGDWLRALEGSGKSLLLNNPATRLVGDFLKNGLTIDIGRFQK